MIPSPGNLPDPGIKPMCPLSPVLAGELFTPRATCEAQELSIRLQILSIFVRLFSVLLHIFFKISFPKKVKKEKSMSWLLLVHKMYLIYTYRNVAQSCPTLCDPMDCSPPGSSVHGIFQAIVLEWTAISFSSGSSPPRHLANVS